MQEQQSNELDVSAIRMDGGTQMREAISEATVERYAEHIQDGVEFPPVVIFYDGADYWLADGFHRVHAYRAAGVEHIPADIRSGQRIDAIRYALSANATNGKPRTGGDMRRAYDVAVNSGLCDAAGVAAVKELLGCSVRWAHELTAMARQAEKASRDAEIQRLHSEGLSQREIAVAVGLSHVGVGKILDSGNKRNSSESYPPAEPLPDEELEELLDGEEYCHDCDRTHSKWWGKECGYCGWQSYEGAPLDADEQQNEPQQKHVHVSANSGNNEWYTPPEIVECARRALGAIDFDPASSEVANRTVKAAEYLTEDDDGLTVEWRGRTFMNPPYSQPLIGQFCEAAVTKYAAGEITAACVLTNNATETRWLQGLLSKASAVCFIRGRIKYLNAQGVPENTPLQGQCVTYLGPDPKAFMEAFAEMGECWRRG